ncbi:MAG: hypothetical protein DRQ78_05920 [Epsilonproteobacteria bacterium]|nr:MAG: hypothetical protein DRQ78_05920 [Campylobacterota bacterium]
MRSFKQLNMLHEKVSKKEINDGLNDRNILMGVEYEFIFNQDAISDESEIDALKAYRKLRRSIAEDRDKAVDEEDEYNKAIMLSLAVTKDAYNDKSIAITNKAHDLIRGDVDLEAVKKSKEWLDLEEKHEEYNEIMREIRDLQDTKKHYIDAVYHSEMHDEIDWIDLPEENSWEEQMIYTTMPDHSEYEDYFNWMSNYKGVDVDFDEFKGDMDDYIYGQNSDFSDMFDAQYLVEPTGGEYDSYPDSNDWENIFGTFFEDDSNLPFDVYKAQYFDVDDSRDHDEWSVGSDSSLSYIGCEIVSPVENISTSVNDLKGMFKFINSNGYTDHKCGLHVNMSYKGKSFDSFDFLKVMLFMNEGHITEMFGDNMRDGRGYAKSVIEKIKTNVKDMTSGMYSKQIPMDKVFDDFRRGISLPYDRYFGVNITNAKNMGNHSSARLEFRYIGGTDYSKKEKFVTAQIGRYAHYMKLGFDSSYKKKEYITKLTRLYNKFYYTKPLDKKEYSKEQLVQMYKKGEFIGADEKGYQFILYRNMVYIIEPSDYTVEGVSTLSKARNADGYPLFKPNGFSMSLISLRYKEEVEVKISKYNKRMMSLYIGSGNKEYLILDEYYSITPLNGHNHIKKGKKVEMV